VRAPRSRLGALLAIAGLLGCSGGPHNRPALKETAGVAASGPPRQPVQTIEPRPAAVDTTPRPAPRAANAPESSPGTRLYPVPQAHKPATPPVKYAPAAPPNPIHAAKREVYDPDNPSFALLQAPHNALRGFPLDSNGRVDWVQALEQRLIAPRADRDGQGGMRILDLDIVMKDTRDMPWVRFPHRQHTEWLACSNCHPSPFVEKSAANPIDMDAIFRGRYCGQCHDRVAFSVFLCERCHSVPHPGAPSRWW
jgi:c(7)-type cytochrome triheme protein